MKTPGLQLRDDIKTVLAALESCLDYSDAEDRTSSEGTIAEAVKRLKDATSGRVPGGQGD